MITLKVGDRKIHVDKPIQFSGGERHVQLPEVLYKADQVEMMSRVSSSDELMDTVLTIDALGYLMVHKLNITIPYMPYGRQDGVYAKGQAFSLSVAMGMLQLHKAQHPQMNTQLFTVDAHSPYLGLFEVHQHQLISMDSDLNQWIQTNRPTLVCPDAGARRKSDVIMGMTRNMFVGRVFGKKVRNPKTGWIEKYSVEGDVDGKDCLIVDDICDGGMTFNLLAKQLKEKGAKNIVLFVTHGIWSKGFKELNKHIYNFYTTNTIEQTNLPPENVIKIV